MGLDDANRDFLGHRIALKILEEANSFTRTLSSMAPWGKIMSWIAVSIQPEPQVIR
jgi:hypothetical protein